MMIINTIRQLNSARKRIPMLSYIRHKAAYEGEGKTTVKVINQDYELGLMIDSYATYGFKLNNGLTVLGPMAIFPRTVLSWQVTEATAINEDSLKLFKLLEPKIDLLQGSLCCVSVKPPGVVQILGLDTQERRVVDAVLRCARASRLNVEILATEHACSTFNFLNAEGRCVAAALIPPTIIANVSEDDMLQTKLHYQDVFNKTLH